MPEQTPSSPIVPTAAALHATLQQALAPTFLEVLDESAQHAGHAVSGGRTAGTHFRVRIASPQFAGQPRVAAHRMVYAAVQPYIDAGLHALAIDIVG